MACGARSGMQGNKRAKGLMRLKKNELVCGLGALSPTARGTTGGERATAGLSRSDAAV